MIFLLPPKLCLHASVSMMVVNTSSDSSTIPFVEVSVVGL